MATTKDDSTQGAVAPKPATPLTPEAAIRQNYLPNPANLPVITPHIAPTSSSLVVPLQGPDYQVPNFYGRLRPSTNPVVRYERESYVSYLNSLADTRAQRRLAMIPTTFLQENPWTSAWMALQSGATDYELQQVWRHLPKTWGYLKTENPSFLLAKARALYIQKPEVRAEVLDQIRSAEFATGGVFYRTLGELTGLPEPGFVSPGAAGMYAQRAYGPNEQPSIESEIEQALLGLAQTAFKPLDAAFQGIAGQAGRSAHGGLAATANILDLVGADGASDWLRNYSAEDIKNDILQGVNFGFGRLTDVASGSLGYALGRVGQDSGSPMDAMRYMWPTDDDPKTNWFHDTAIGQGFGMALADARGLTPGTQEYDAYAGAMSFVAQMVVGAAVGKATAGFKAGGEAIAPEAGFSAEVADALTRQYGAIGRKLYEWRATGVSELTGKTADGITQTLAQLRDLPPSEWNQVTAARDVFNKITESNAQHASEGERASALMQSFKQDGTVMDPEVAKILAKTTNPVEAMLAVEDISLGRPNMLRLGELKAQQANVIQELRDFTPAAGEAEAGIGEMFAQPGEAPGSIRTYRDLQAKKAILDLEVEQAMSPPATYPMLEYPTFSKWGWLKNNLGDTRLGRAVSFLYSPYDDPSFWMSRYKIRHQPIVGVEAEVGTLTRPAARPAFRLASWSDDVGDSTFGLPGLKPDNLRHNLDLIEKFGRRGGLKPTEVRRFMADMLDIKPLDHTAFKEFSEQFASALKGSKLVADNMPNGFLRTGTSTLKEREYATFVRRHIDADGNPLIEESNILYAEVYDSYTGKLIGRLPKPPMSGYFLDDFYWPYDDMLEATSWIKSKGRDMAGNPKPTVYRGAHALSIMMTLGLKPLVLMGFGLRAFTLGMRIMGEERIRAHFARVGGLEEDRALFPFGNVDGEGGHYVYRPVFGTGKNVEGGLMHLAQSIHLDAKGLLHPRKTLLNAFRMETESLTDVAMSEQLGQLVVRDIASGRMSPDHINLIHNATEWRKLTQAQVEEIGNYYWQMTRFVRGSPELKELVRRGPDAWATWLDSEDPKAVNFRERYFKTTLDAPDITMPTAQFARNLHDYLTELSGGDAGLLDAFAGHGNWNMRGRYGGVTAEQFAGAGPGAEPAVRWTPRTLTEAERHELVDVRGAGQVSREDWGSMGSLREGWNELGTAPNGDVVYGTGSAAINEWLGKHSEGVEQFAGIQPAATGEMPASEYSRLVGEVDDLRADIQRMYASGDHASVGELTKARREMQDRLSQLEREGNLRESQTINVDDRRQFINRVMDLAGQFDDDGNPLFRLPYRLRGLKDIGSPDRGILPWINQKLYAPFRHIVAPLDTMLVRGPTYSKIANATYQRLLNFGWSEERASAAAYLRAAEETKALFYDLNARSSMDRELKNVFWFLPAWREVLTMWGKTIPSKYYWPVGMAYLYNRVHLLRELGHDMGWLKKDPASGDELVTVPFLGDLFDKVESFMGAEDSGLVKGIVKFNPANMSFIASSGFAPGLSTQWNMVLTAMTKASDKAGGPMADMMHTISDIFQPFGDDQTFGPQSLSYAYTALTGKEPFWEPLAQEHIHRLYDMGADDAMRQARVIVGAPPDPADPKYDRYPESGGLKGELTPAGEQQYLADRKDWSHQMDAEAHSLIKAAALMRLLGATFFPTSFRLSDEYKQDAQPFLKELYGNDALYVDESNRVIHDYIESHPGGYFYLVGKTMVGENAKPLPYPTVNEDDYWKLFEDGEREVLSPSEFITKAAAWETRRVYYGQLEQSLREISPTLDPVELLSHGFERSAANLDYVVDWANYQKLNPEYASYIQQVEQRNFQVNPDEKPTWGSALQRVLDTKRFLQEHASEFSIEGIPTPAYKKMVAELNQIIGANAKGEVPSKFAFEEEMNWYYAGPMSDYMTKTGPLFNKANQAAQEGSDQGVYYDEVRRIANEWSGKTITHNGHTFPSPEAVLFGNRTPADQKAATAAWATRPPNWLSDFQLTTVGIEPTPAVHAFFDNITQAEASFDEYVKSADISQGSTEYDQALATKDAWLAQQAQSLGPDAQRMYALSKMDPVERLVETGQIKGEAWNVLLDSYSQTKTAAANLGVNPTFWSESVTPWKVWFFLGLQAFTDKTSEFYDETLTNELDKLSLAFPLEQGYRRNVLLWDALFFGNFHLETPLVAPIGVREQFSEAS